jgi:hypothetical protein
LNFTNIWRSVEVPGSEVSAKFGELAASKFTF